MKHKILQKDNINKAKIRQAELSIEIKMKKNTHFSEILPSRFC
jgi:hypothetical protein